MQIHARSSHLGLLRDIPRSNLPQASIDFCRLPPLPSALPLVRSFAPDPGSMLALRVGLLLLEDGRVRELPSELSAENSYPAPRRPSSCERLGASLRSPPIPARLSTCSPHTHSPDRSRRFLRKAHPQFH